MYYLFIYSSSAASSFCFFFCFFFLLLLLLLLLLLPPLGVGCHFGRRVRLPFLAGEVDCFFWPEVGCLVGGIFFRVVVILRACVRVAVAEFLWSVTDLTKDESPHTGYTFTPWVVSFTPPSIEHQVGGTSILRLFRRTVVFAQSIEDVVGAAPTVCHFRCYHAALNIEWYCTVVYEKYSTILLHTRVEKMKISDDKR